MSNGKGCRCNAHCEHECCCDADWTTKEVYDLRAELATRTAERDEARREVCLARCNPWIPEHHLTVAAERGWNCFDAKEVQP
jgi:hypothetical protein